MYKTLAGAASSNKEVNLDPANMLRYNSIIQVSDGQKFIMLKKEADKDEKRFDGNEIFITYKKGNESFLRQEDSYTGVIIDKNGYYDEGLEWKGNIGVYRINMLLPFEFMPSQK